MDLEEGAARITRLPNSRIFNKKLYKLPELGGGMGIGYSGNAQKKTFFSGGDPAGVM